MVVLQSDSALVSGRSSTGVSGAAIWADHLTSDSKHRIRGEWSARPRLTELSDDGGMYFAVVAEGAGGGGGDELLVFNATSGELLRTVALGPVFGLQGEVVSVQASRNGARLVVKAGAQMGVIDTIAGTMIGPLIISPAKGPVMLCPMGVFMCYDDGNSTATVLRYNSTANEYNLDWQVSPAPLPASPASDWELSSSVASVNGEAKNPDGCLVAMAWNSAKMKVNAFRATSNKQPKSMSRVELYSLLSQEHYWSWSSDSAQQSLGVTQLQVCYPARSAFYLSICLFCLCLDIFSQKHLSFQIM